MVKDEEKRKPAGINARVRFTASDPDPESSPAIGCMLLTPLPELCSFLFLEK
ncbi:MAG: hypothetical protein OP8BY_0246 [Candidatus Saccharicenans subterraneus]|uniref:Uncharacterized protein n=1 Tax=Candidatus Saccharicenans subterraneus TaxID=2508984 RepID=A0A3E2BLI6_9BACT|nr:MAG: hypothetical protein OP8BY_0246 [Candidatus Saccharicenans subterraneum]